MPKLKSSAVDRYKREDANAVKPNEFREEQNRQNVLDEAAKARNKHAVDDDDKTLEQAKNARGSGTEAPTPEGADLKGEERLDDVGKARGGMVSKVLNRYKGRK